MATVSEGLGMQEANTASTFLRQMAILLTQLINDGKKKGYQDEHMKGAKAILKHIKNGGKTSYQMVDIEDAALFEKILKHERIAYVKMAATNGKSVFVTKDEDDKLVKHAFDILSDELKISYREATPHEFINDHAGQNVCQSVGYSEVELEVFRKEAAKMGFTYAVVGNERDKGKHDILYAERDKDMVIKALKSMEYELSGADGNNYGKALELSVKVKIDILRASKQNRGEILYLVNANNPMQFITLSDGKMVEHNLSIEEKRDRTGKMQKIVKDMTKQTYPFGNRELTAVMRMYGKCSLIPNDKMSFINGYDSVGNVIAQDPMKMYNSMVGIKTDCQGSVYPTYESNLSRQDVIPDTLCTLSNVETDKIVKLAKEFDKAGITYVTANGNVAYKEQDKKAVSEILNRTVYKDMTFTDRFNAMLFYEGRGPEEFDLKDPKETVYITSAKNPEYVLRMDKDGCTVIKNGEEVMQLAGKDDNYEERLESLLGTMEDIAVITEAEAKKDPEERVRIIEERALVKENEASIQYSKSYEERKEHFLNTDFESMKPEDKEIFKRYTAHEIKVTYVDRTFTEKIIDRDFGTKMKEEKAETTRTRNTEPDR